MIFEKHDWQHDRVQNDTVDTRATTANERCYESASHGTIAVPSPFRIIDELSVSNKRFNSQKETIFQSKELRLGVEIRFINFGFDQAPQGHTLPRLPQVGSQTLRDVAQLEGRKDHGAVAYSIKPAFNSNSRLDCSEEFFQCLMRKYGAARRLQDYIMCYGFKPYDNDLVPPALRFRTLDVVHDMLGRTNETSPSTADTFRGFELVYGLRYPSNDALSNPHADGSRDEGAQKWKIRQNTVYQKLDLTRGISIWIFIAPSRETQRCVDRFLQADWAIRRNYSNPQSLVAEQQHFLCQSLLTHITIIENSIVDWRWYISNLVDQTQGLAERVILADVASPKSADMPFNLPVDFADRQTLRRLEDSVLNLQLMLDATFQTTSKLQSSLFKYASQVEADGTKSMQVSLSEISDEILLFQAKANALLERVKGLSTLLCDSLAYDNAAALKEDNELLRGLTVKTSRDSDAIKIITIITVFFLPATVVAVSFASSLENYADQATLELLLHSICQYFRRRFQFCLPHLGLFRSHNTLDCSNSTHLVPQLQGILTSTSPALRSCKNRPEYVKK